MKPVVVWQQWDKDGRVIRRLYAEEPRTAAPSAIPSAPPQHRISRGVVAAEQPDLL